MSNNFEKLLLLFCIAAPPLLGVGDAMPAQEDLAEYQDQQAVEEAEAAQEIEAVGKDVTTNTIDFLNKYSPTPLDAAQQSFILDQINKGKTYLKAILENKLDKIPVKFYQPFNAIQRDYLDAIIAISWALYDKAIATGQGFTGGTIVFEDKGHLVFSFLFDYAKKANETLATGKRNPKYISQNCFAYERHSTHFPELQKLYPQFGIDIRYADGDLKPVLPTDKAQILFGDISTKNKALTFHKMEQYGLCFRDGSFIKHTVKFAKGKKSKKGPGRREDLPKAVKKKVAKMLDAIPKKSNRKAIENEIGDPAVIKNIYTVAKKLAAQTDAPEVKAAQALVTYIETNFDNLDIRRGDEVILTSLV